MLVRYAEQWGDMCMKMTIRETFGRSAVNQACASTW